MTASIGKGTLLPARTIEHLQEFFILGSYLCVCFVALSYLKAVILQSYGIPYAPFGFAVLKALICAKFMVIGRALRIGERFEDRPLIWRTMYNSLVFMLLLVFLNALEEILKALWHGRTLADSLVEVAGGRLHQVIAVSVIMLLILIPFFAFRSLGEAIGERRLVRLFFHTRTLDGA